ncbi:heme biosynthesis protein HemY [Aquincola sp. S2]|uniref:Heme biosynthesis protein HemY n=1 Tax=Pseudaquabacterium terrae TaxID=2732868 RepID=A0ABX2EFF4_9BURK|nr:heme biosynthesis HemY N-terminal domain-containing protein [Aquabacterium terrae]NRF67365.1 heme biosynthesis protein HemY [Aquabacterium terrae]
MRSVIWLVLLFVVAVVAALTLGDNDGVASFYWGAWRLDMSLNFFMLAALATGFIIFSVAQAINSLIGLPERAREWRALRVERAAQAALREAMAEYYGGRYTRAYKAAQRALGARDDAAGLSEEREFRVLAHLLASGSLHRLQDRGRRDEMLARVLRPGQRVNALIDEGARLLAAEWALDDRDAATAEAWLAELPPGVARRTQALRLKLQAARLARRPLEALHTARLLANHQAFSSIAAQGLLRSLAFEVLDEAHDIDQLRRAWHQFDIADQRDPFVAARAARRAAVLGHPEDGCLWLKPLWERLDELGTDGRAQVALALVEVVAGVGADWLPRVEAAQRDHPTESAVQGAVGAVLFQRQLWGKARKPLEQAAKEPALESRARRRAWRTLAALAREEADEDRAAACDRAAAEID